MAVALVALLASIGGGTALALSGHNTVSSGDIKPDAVKSSDINDGGVKSSDIDPALLAGLISPRGIVTVNAAGVIQPNFPPLNVAQSNVVKPAGSTGIYCFTGLPFTVRGAVGNDAFDEADEFVSITPGQVGACPDGTQVTVRTRDQAGSPANSGFTVVFP